MHGQLSYAYEYVVCEYVSHMRGDGGTYRSPLGDICCTMGRYCVVGFLLHISTILESE